MIKMTDGTIHIPEDTVADLMMAVSEAYSKLTFVSSPMPNEDMDPGQRCYERARRGTIEVVQAYGTTKFVIELNGRVGAQHELESASPFTLDLGTIPDNQST